MTQLIFSALPRPRRPITYIPPDLKVKDCIQLMSDKDIGALVIKEDDRVTGMISERDIVRGCLQLSKKLDDIVAKDIAFTEISILNSNDPIEKAMQTITQTKRRHILIEENNNLIAILSIGDLLVHLLEDKSRTIQHLENYIHN